MFELLNDRRKPLLWSIHNVAENSYVLLLPYGDASTVNPLCQHQRYSIRCPAEIYVETSDGRCSFVMTVIEMSFSEFQAESNLALPLGH